MRARFSFKTRLRLAAIAAILIPVATAASPALAHDSLSATSPASDAVLIHTPESVSLTLSEPLADSKNPNFSIITVTDGAGKTVGDGTVTVPGPTLSTKLAGGDPGTYKVLWRTVSSDGHPIEGNYTFTVQTPAGQTTTPYRPLAPAGNR
ncbi:MULTISPECIES: copper resistance CopC family protein [unclassified Arthrobacter]|uniref:copper resistance CopC family protein n=1 Tax=unclassified Arthrobacter TaxID=235627 RepID=UPI002E00D447|nr:MULTISPECIES: copper resistance CopC family protein [unclassified Arthrobacter]MEC5193262.1 methionine-rich copper-binding protein CopC [Arthrobacter sp. MP_M4]MEC5204728.1 methionine-rich copper-binding protein CopC [Arthrobacter sp. MP_M7]